MPLDPCHSNPTPVPPGPSHAVPAGGAQFAATHWSVVLQAANRGTPQAESALEQLCRTYWYPLYTYVRRRGFGPADAEDLTQEFFARLLQRPFLARVGPEKGRFRSFLLASMNNFLANEWDRAKAEKRGGRIAFVSMEGETPEARFAREDIPDQQAERAFENRWALMLLETTFNRLQAETNAAGKGGLFEKLRGFLDAEPMAGEYSQIATELNWTPGAVAVAVHRLRGRYRQLLIEEVARTVADPREADDELRHLLGALQ